MKSNKIAITGAAGLIGHHLFNNLKEQNYEVVGLDNYSLSYKKNDEIETIDLTNKVATNSFFARHQPHTVVHCASWAHAGLGLKNPTLITEQNINIFLNTIVPAINNGLKHFVFFSTVLAYGKGSDYYTENDPLAPQDVYSANKVFIETTLKLLAKQYNFTYTILRLYNVFGEGQFADDPYRNVVAIFMKRILFNEPLMIEGEGDQLKGFTYVRDIVPSIIEATVNPNTFNQEYNLGSKNYHSIKSLINMIEEVSGHNAVVLQKAPRSHENVEAHYDLTKASLFLRFKDETPIGQALENTWRDYYKRVTSQKLEILPEVYETS